MKKTSEINIRDPFVPLSDGPVTPADWECLDGTLYVAADGTPYLVFCHEWLQVKDGEMCAMPLTPDLTAARTAACCKKFAQPNAARCSAAAFFGAWVRGRGSKPPAQKGESSHGTHTNSCRFPAGRAGHACDLRAVCGAYRRQL